MQLLTTDTAALEPAPQRGVAWPDAVAYQEAVQNPAHALGDSDLRTAQVVLDRRGLPLAYSGRFAVVFRLRTPAGEEWALRCFTQPPDLNGGDALDERAACYALREAYLGRPPRCPGFVPFRYLPRGVRVGPAWYPVLAMKWAAGDALGAFIERRLHEPAALVDLCRALGDLRNALEAAGIAHGDWQHDNILVSGDGRSVTLVDYDDLFVPVLAGRSAPGEQGHANYQHPDRAPGDWGPGADRFAHLVIQTGLLALVHDGSLWSRFGDGESVLFQRADLLRPGETLIWQAVSETARAAGDDLLAACLARLEAACKTPGPAGVLLSPDAIPPVSAAYRDAVRRRQEAAHAVLKRAATATQQAVEAARPAPAPAAQMVAEKPRGRYHAELTSREMRALERQHVWVTRAAGAFFAVLMYAPTTPEMVPLYVFSLALGLPLLFGAGYGFWPRKKLLAVLNQAIEGALSAAHACDDLLDAKRRRLRDIDATPYLNNLALFVRAELAAVSIKKAGSVPGIGPRTLKALRLAGIENAGDLAVFSALDAVSEKKKSLLDAWYADREARATNRFRDLNDERRALENDLRRLRQEKDDHLHKREGLLSEHEAFPPATTAAFVQELLSAW